MNIAMKFLSIFAVILILANGNSASLEVFNDDELLALLNSEKFVVVLFSKYFVGYVLFIS